MPSSWQVGSAKSDSEGAAGFRAAEVNKKGEDHIMSGQEGGKRICSALESLPVVTAGKNQQQL